LTALLIHGLLGIFTKFIRAGNMRAIKSSPENSPQNIAISWLRGNLVNYTNQLQSLLASSDQKIRVLNALSLMIFKVWILII
jgi:hypothetical protein